MAMEDIISDTLINVLSNRGIEAKVLKRALSKPVKKEIYKNYPETHYEG